MVGVRSVAGGAERCPEREGWTKRSSSSVRRMSAPRSLLATVAAERRAQRLTHGRIPPSRSIMSPIDMDSSSKKKTKKNKQTSAFPVISDKEIVWRVSPNFDSWLHEISSTFCEHNVNFRWLNTLFELMSSVISLFYSCPKARLTFPAKCKNTTRDMFPNNFSLGSTDPKCVYWVEERPSSWAGWGLKVHDWDKKKTESYRFVWAMRWGRAHEFWQRLYTSTPRSSFGSFPDDFYLT